MFTYGVIATLVVFGLLSYIRLMKNLTSPNYLDTTHEYVKGALASSATDVFIGYVFIRVLTVYFWGW